MMHVLTYLSIAPLLASGVAAVAVEEGDGPPDFSSFLYPGSPQIRSFKPQYDFCIVGGRRANH